VSCLGRKNRASQLNPRHSDVYRSLGSKLFQGVATMTFTSSQTRPRQKDLGVMVNPLVTYRWVQLCTLSLLELRTRVSYLWTYDLYGPLRT
jgi:hypothetical protein